MVIPKMRLLLVTLFVVSASALVEVQKSYHKDIGIPLAAEIKAYEDALFANAARSADKIVGGVVAPINAHPYLAGLIVNFLYSTTRSACGSSIITPNRLVTAAHCWFDGVNQASSFDVVFGSPTLFSGGITRRTSNVVMHPQWTPSLYRNDVAMIYIATPIAYSMTIQPVALPSGNELFNSFAGQWTIASGYGKTSDFQTSVPLNTVVSQVNLQVITHQECVWEFGSDIVTASTLCTNGRNRVGICGGDSGGPLVVQTIRGPVLVGISSFAARDGCQLGHHSGFARATSFVSFIQQHL